jgi:hypothetical protein
MQNLDYRVERHNRAKKIIRKAAGILYNVEDARRYGQGGIVSVVSHVGVLSRGKAI